MMFKFQKIRHSIRLPVPLIFMALKYGEFIKLLILIDCTNSLFIIVLSDLLFERYP